MFKRTENKRLFFVIYDLFVIYKKYLCNGCNDNKTIILFINNN